MKIINKMDSTGDRLSRRKSDREIALEKEMLEIKSSSSRIRLNRGKLLHKVQFPSYFYGMTCVRYSPRGDVIATSFGAGTIQIRDLQGHVVHAFQHPTQNRPPVMCLRFNPKMPDLLYVATSGGKVLGCHIEKRSHETLILEPRNEINSLDVDKEGLAIVTGGKNAAVCVYDANTLKSISVYKRPDLLYAGQEEGGHHSMRIFCVMFDPTDPHVVLSGGWDNTIKIWDLRIKRGFVRDIYGPHICGEAIGMRGNTVLTGSWSAQHSLQLWDYRTCRLLESVMPVNRQYPHNGEFLYVTKYFDGDPHGDLVITGGSGVKALEVISLRGRCIVGTFPLQGTTQTADSHHHYIAFGGFEPQLQIVDFY